jgi:hypothetical protein
MSINMWCVAGKMGSSMIKGVLALLFTHQASAYSIAPDTSAYPVHDVVIFPHRASLQVVRPSMNPVLLRRNVAALPSSPVTHRSAAARALRRASWPAALPVASL